MAFINRQDTDGTKALLIKGELGYDDYTAGGDAGRVYVGTGTVNIPLQTKNNATFTGSITEQTAVGTDAIVATGGTGLYRTLTANTTLTDGLSEGQSLIYVVTNAGFTLTYPTITWWGGAEPTLATTDKIKFEKINNVLYGTHEGSI